jgi:hypothetical protein
MISFIKKIVLFFDLTINHGIDPFTVIKNRKPLLDYTSHSHDTNKGDLNH